MSKIFIDNVTKGDTLNLQCTLNTDISGWSIRAELYDNDGCRIKKANSSVTGGASSQIQVTNSSDGVFIIKFAKDETKNFNDRAFLEVENTNTPTEKFTIVRGEDTEINFRDQQITWDNNS